MGFNHYLEDEDDKPYFSVNSLSYYYDKLAQYARLIEGFDQQLIKTIRLNEERLKELSTFWDEKMETFDDGVKDLLVEWVDDGTIDHVVDTTIVDKKIAPLNQQLADTEQRKADKADVDQVRSDFDAVVANVTNGNENATNTEIAVARKGATTLGRRLDSIEAEKENVKKKYFRVNGPGDFTVFLPINGNEYAGYRFLRDTVENFIKMWEQSIFRMDSGDYDTETTKNYGTVSGGTMLATTTANHYTTTVGTKLTTTFTGHTIYGRFFTRYDGGLWRVTVDGVAHGTVSTWSAAIGLKEELIASNIPNGEHTLVLEYIGADPEHPPTTSDGVTPATARGWIKANVGSNVNDASFRIQATESSDFKMTKLFDLTEGFSNKEFALEVREAGTSNASEWFPAHSGVGTTNTGTTGFQRLTIDGVTVDIESPKGIAAFKRGNFSQVMESKLSRDTETRAELKLLLSFDDGGRVSQYFEAKFLQPTEIRNGYAFMLPMKGDYASRIKTDRREIITTSTTETGNFFYNDLTALEFIASSSFPGKENYYMRADITNRSHDMTSLYLNRRDTGLQKLYPKFFSATNMEQGQKIWFDGFFEVGKIEGADRIFA